MNKRKTFAHVVSQLVLVILLILTVSWANGYVENGSRPLVAVLTILYIEIAVIVFSLIYSKDYKHDKNNNNNEEG